MISTVQTLEVGQADYFHPQVRVRFAKLNVRLLFEIAMCVVPAMTLVAFGALYAGSRWLFGSMLLLVGLSIAMRRYTEATAIVVALVPAMMLLRGAFYYSAPIVILMAPVLVHLGSSPNGLANLKKNKPLIGLLLVALVYWWVSFARSGDYSSNLRILELSFAAADVYLLAQSRSLLATAMLGISLCGLSLAIALLPYGDRLGSGEIEDMSIGNPIALGLSATLIFLLTIVDRGQWLFVERNPIWQAILAAIAALELALSTSRGSWLVTLVGLIIILLFNDRSRKLLLGTVILVSIAIVILLQTSRGVIIMHYYDNVAGSDKSWAKRTTGRSDQWESFPQVFRDSPIWGFGPGSGKSVSLRYTAEGKPWHAIYLLVGAETGLMGLTFLALLLWILTHRGYVHWRVCGELAPLMALLCFMVIGVSVSGIDAISGVFLGFAFLGGTALTSSFRETPMLTEPLLPGSEHAISSNT